MEKKLKILCGIGVVVTYVIAGGWHFIYDALPSVMMGAIAPVNESPWEHAKLFFVPVLIWGVALYFIAGRHLPNFVFAQSAALLFMPVLLLLLYYAYESFFEETLAIDLVNAFVTIAAGAYLAYRLTIAKKALYGKRYRIAALIIIAALFIVFTVFTFWPPHCGLFWDSSSQRYGLPPA